MACDERDLELRRNLKLQLIQNPNYFGNLSELDLEGIPAPVEQKISDTSLEELTCIGYNPHTQILTAIVEIKEETGYLGGPCTAGSHEYVRFYLDYGAGWIDHGSVAFNIHDLGFSGTLCYAVSIKIKPEKTSCCEHAPVLPRVRGILSWSIEPPPNMPGYLPVWGNRLERVIQIEPRNPFFCFLTDPFELPGVVEIDPGLLQKVKDHLSLLEPPENPAPQLADLIKKVDSKVEIAPLRAVFPMVAKLAADNTDIAAFKALDALKSLEIDISKFDDFFLNPNFNTTFEELHCVGLDRDLDLLHGVIEIKRPWGYGGDLCAKGSREFIAFYLDFGSGWEYQGTTWVDVHDITEVKENSLWYQASLPVYLDEERKKWCETGRARIRGILSWAVPPPPNQPNHVPHWGDREDCWIEIKPLPKGVKPGVVTPFIESIGAMPVDQINGTGYANGASIGGTFTADDSPFGGVIRIAGQVAFPTNNLEYRVMVKGPSDATFKPWTKNFKVTVITVAGGTITISNVTQTATADWFNYIPQTGPVFKSVVGNLLAPFTATDEGLHQVFIQIRLAGSSLVLATSATEAFFVDNTRPDMNVEITSGTGNCGKFSIGDVITGTYSMKKELHSRSLRLWITPAAEAAGGHLAFTSVTPMAPLPPPLPGPSASNALSYSALTLLTSGASGTWQLNTNGMDACGYNIRLRGEDRTIVDSGTIGWEGGDNEGFCLE